MTEQHENDGRDLNTEASSEEQPATETPEATPDVAPEAQAEATPDADEESSLEATTDVEDAPAPLDAQGAEDTEVTEVTEAETVAEDAIADAPADDHVADHVAEEGVEAAPADATSEAAPVADEPAAQAPVADGASSDADATEAAPAEATGGSDEAKDDPDGSSKEGGKRRRRRQNKKPPVDLSPELDQLVELATKYPDIGPSLAQLAYKLDRRDIGDRVVRMGLNDEQRGVEFYFVAADAARRQGRHDDAIGHVVEALESFAASPEGADANERQRLLRLVRRGFQVLMFDVEDVASRPQRTVAIRERLEALEPHFTEDHFFFTLLAQAVWFDDRERSEALWEKAVTMDDQESAWNARGTWYKEAESDLGKAEATYRQGLKTSSDSSLLRLNLAQALMDRAGGAEADPGQARGWVREAEGLLRNALRGAPRHLRRHIHENLDRANALVRKLPKPEAPKLELGQRVKGKVVSLKPYGAFLALQGGHTGLLHKSEMAHEWVDDATQYVKAGDTVEVEIIELGERDNGGLRIGLSRKPLLPAPEPGAATSAPRPQAEGEGGERRERNSRGRGGRGRGRGGRGGQGGQGGRGGQGGGRGQGGGGRGNQSGGGGRGNQGGGGRGNQGGQKGGDDATPGAFTLGDLLLAKLNEKSGDKSDDKGE